jgi:two-component system, CitB family, sensor kinase
MRRLLARRLSTQVVIMQIAILVVTIAAGFAVVQWNLRRQADSRYEQQALVVAQSVASQPGIISGVETGRPGGEVQRLAMAAMHSTHALFVVVTNAQGIRFSHPTLRLIGQPVQDDKEPRSTEPFRTGKAWTGLQRGTLGLVAGGKVPLTDHGRLIGEVSVGFPVIDVSRQLAGALRSLAAFMILALALGVVAALGFARWLKRQTFGLELREIAGLLQEREAMLHGIREAVLGYDRSERVLLANDAARQLLGLPPDFEGRPLRHLLPPGRLADVATGTLSGADLLVVAGNRILVGNRMPIRVAGRRHLGWVVTFHDQTESETLKRELDEAIGMTDSLRAQSHEFANRLHTFVGLVELGQYDQAIRFVTDVSAARDAMTEKLRQAIGDAKLVALILAKSSLADERGVSLRLAEDSQVAGEITDIGEVLTVTGNLLDNAIEATALSRPAQVDVTIVSAGADLLIRVRDSGAGVPDEAREAVFTDGFTTKSSPAGARRGLGLALVRQITERRGGMISVGRDGGAVFTTVLPGVVVTTAEPSDPVPSSLAVTS